MWTGIRERRRRRRGGGAFKFGHRAAALRSSKPPLEVAVEVEGCGSSLSPSGLEQGRHRGRQTMQSGRQRAGRHRWACAFTTAIHRKGSHREKRKAWINIFAKRCASGQPRQRTCALPLQVIVKAVAAKSERLGSIFFTKRFRTTRLRGSPGT